MLTKRSLEGYLLVDHRNSPGLTERDSAAIQHAFRGMAPQDIPLRELGAGQVLETPTFTCGHCSKVVILNPRRTRDRGWCGGCDRYLCDGCGLNYKLTRACQSFAALLDRLQARFGRALNLTEV